MAYQGYSGSGFVGNFASLSILESSFPASRHAGRMATITFNGTILYYFSDGSLWLELNGNIPLTTDAAFFIQAGNREPLTWVFETPITLSPSHFGLFRDGDILDFSAITTSGVACINVAGYVGDINIASSYTQPHVIQGLHIVGSGAAGVVCLQPEGSSGPQTHKYQVTFRNCTFRNFDITFRLNRDTWGWVWDTCHFRPTISCYAVAWMAGTRPDGQPMTNAGERMTFINCTALNGGTFLRQEWGNTCTHIVSCSIDQFDSVANITTGQVLVQGGHYECIKNTGNWFRAAGANANIRIEGSVFYLPLGSTYNDYNVFYSDRLCRTGGITVEGIHMSINNTYNLAMLCGGEGLFRMSRVTLLDAGPQIAGGIRNSRVERASTTNCTAPWVISGTGVSKVVGQAQPFNTGTGREPRPGQTITTGTSSMTLTDVITTSGTWGTDAAGTIYGFPRTGSLAPGDVYSADGVPFAIVQAGGTTPAGLLLEFDGANPSQSATLTLNCNANQQPFMAFLAELSGGKNLRVNYSYLNAAGSVITYTMPTDLLVTGNGVKRYADCRSRTFPAPAGTTQCRITVTSDNIAGNAKMSILDVEIQ